MAQAFRHNEAEIAVEQFEDGTVIINFLTGRYFALNDTGHLLWDALRLGADATGLADLLASCRRPPGTNPDVAADAEAFLDCLVRERLVMACASADFTPAAGRDLDYAPPRIDVYDDLADLIVLDPIHEVNEQLGWPVAANSPSRK